MSELELKRDQGEESSLAISFFFLTPCECGLLFLCMFSDGVSHQCLCSPLGLPVIDVGMCLEVNNKALRKEEIHSDLISVLLLALLGVCLSAPVH